MKLRRAVSCFLIFILIMPVIIIACSATAYAFGGFDLDSGFFNILKGLLALFFIGRLADRDDAEEVSADNQNSDNNSTSDVSKEDTTDSDSAQDEDIQTEQPVIVEDEATEDKRDDWTKIEVSGFTKDESYMLDLINQERKNKGLKPLKINLKLLKVARAKSKDMIENNYFDHFSPVLGSPFEMMRSLNIDYYLAGENISGAPMVDLAHQALMDSPTHRENILTSDYTHVGIGIIEGGPYGKMFAQEFADLEN